MAFQQFTLPNGFTAKNRIVKAAMEENMADTARAHNSGSRSTIPDARSGLAVTARKAQDLGFGGVEIHAAHGYLISPFLSPLNNRRSNRWGGSRETRARLLFEVVRAVRNSTSPSFGVAVKINSSDFQRGGFDADDLAWVVQELNAMDLDFLELSGGSVESPVMRSAAQPDPPKKKASTIAREAYFADAAQNLEKITTMPLLTTGGITSLTTVNAVIESSDRALVGVGTAMGLVPNIVNHWACGEDPKPALASSWFLPNFLEFAASTMAVQWNMRRIGEGKGTWWGVWPTYALIVAALSERRQMVEYLKWMNGLTKKVG